MNSLHWASLWLIVCIVFVASRETETSTPTSSLITIIVLHENVDFHKTRAYATLLTIQSMATEEIDQIKSAKTGRFNVDVKLVDDLDIFGWWTLAPLFLKYSDIKSSDWLVLVQETSQIKMKNLFHLLDGFQSKEPVFLGRGIHDEVASIIHHFSFFDDPTKFIYPHLYAGLIVNSAFLRKFKEFWKARENKYDFSIDPKHTEAEFVLQQSGGSIRLTNLPNRFCVVDGESCAIVNTEKFPKCPADRIQRHDLFYAVKTYSGNHKDRVPVIKKTWGKDVMNIVYYSDTADSSIPTHKVSISNTKRGHCAKSYYIMNHFLQTSSRPWLVITDDDSLLSEERLRRLLSCYNPEDVIVVGERYGYGVTVGHGYEYITMGGGMVFSRAAVQLLTSGECGCQQDEDPDDMIIGMCGRSLGVNIIHSPLFHQARPDDYSKAYLDSQIPISFHRFSDLDPLKVFEEYLGGKVDRTLESHDEL